MDKLIIGILVIWGGLWLLGAAFRVLGQIANGINQYLDRTRPTRDRIGHAVGYPLGRAAATLMDYRIVDRFFWLIVIAFIAAASVDGLWLVQSLDGFGGSNFPLVGWVIFGCAAGVLMAAASRVLELGWLGAASVARVPDIEHLRSGEAAADRSFRVRRMVGAFSAIFLLLALTIGYWRSGGYRWQADLDAKTAEISAAASGGKVAILNKALEDAAARLETDPKQGLKLFLTLNGLSQDGMRAEVGRISKAAQQFLTSYRDDTEKSVIEGKPDALARSLAFAEVDKVASSRWLGRLYEAGNGGAQRDLAKAFSFYEEATRGGDKTSSKMLENLAGKMVSQKDEPARQAAFRYWEPRAQKGEVMAWYQLGEWYGNSSEPVELKNSEIWLGKVLNQDTDTAIKGMAFSSLVKKKDLAQGSTRLLDDLAPKYVKGSDQKLKNTAYAYLEQRANAGDPGSALWMGFRFSEGDGVSKDDKKAREWFLKAALQDKDLLIKDRAIAALGQRQSPQKTDSNANQQAAQRPIAVPATPAPQTSRTPVRPEPIPERPAVNTAPSDASGRSGVTPNKTSTMPANASIDYTGRNWTCNAGYRPVGNECQRFPVPANASIDYTGRSWTCNAGYRPVGNECQQFPVPANASIDYTGRSWTCNAGYRPVENECQWFQVPANARIDYTGRNWTCNAGYRPVGNECQRFDVPGNASIDYTGRNWTCNSGFKRVGSECLKI